MTIDAASWPRLKSVVAEALEKRPEERAAFLRGARLEARLHRQAKALLDAYEGRPSFLEDGPAVSLVPRVTPSELGSLAVGDVVDGYRILRTLGRGGMGEVFEAEESGPIRRLVALKLLRRSRLDSRGLARFQAERQFLASMSHPNIAKVFAAGTVAGRPYLAMELLEGLPITDFCDAAGLAVEARIDLFIKVCQGVQHAHQRGVIHRDLKPSNLIVVETDDGPEPKIIDFGISRLTQDNESRLTEGGQWLGTPAYMSPEQAAGRDLDTRSDVYSLGVLLYELLTGCLPFDADALRRQGLDVLLQTLAEAPPPRASRRVLDDGAEARAASRGTAPRALERRLAGDLDAIVFKALEKDPERRYASPHELARDLERHLEDRPLLAVESGTAEAFRKLLRRHRWAVLGSAALLLSLVAGLVGTVGGLKRARAAEAEARLRAGQAQAEAERANAEAERAARVAQFIEEVFQAANPASLESEPGTTLGQVLDRGAARVRKELAEEPVVQARLMTTIGQAYFNAGRLEDGMTLLKEAVEILEDASPESPELALSLAYLGGARSALADYESAFELLLRSVAIRRRIYGGRHVEVASGLHDLGVILGELGRTEEAEKILQESLEIKEDMLGDDHLEVARTLNSLGITRQELGAPAESLPFLARALKIQEEELGPDHPEVPPTLNSLALAHGDLGNFRLAEKLLTRALAIEERTYGPDHPAVAVSWINLAVVAWEGRKDCGLAIDRARRALDIFRRFYPEDHDHRVFTKESLEAYVEACGRRLGSPFDLPGSATAPP